jgi:hypothetical protein
MLLGGRTAWPLGTGPGVITPRFQKCPWGSIVPPPPLRGRSRQTWPRRGCRAGVRRWLLCCCSVHWWHGQWAPPRRGYGLLISCLHRRRTTALRPSLCAAYSMRPGQGRWMMARRGGNRGTRRQQARWEAYQAAPPPRAPRKKASAPCHLVPAAAHVAAEAVQLSLLRRVRGELRLSNGLGHTGFRAVGSTPVQVYQKCASRSIS